MKGEIKMRSLKIIFLASISILFGVSCVWAGGCLIKVDFKTAKLTVSEQGKKHKKVFSVCVPSYNFKKMPVKGRVIGIEMNPSWRPTEGVKEYFRKEYKVELKDYYAPDDPGNPMGAAKILIKFEGKSVPPTVRIHGTEILDSIGERESLGCIRMRDEDILALVKFISGKRTKVIFE